MKLLSNIRNTVAKYNRRRIAIDTFNRMSDRQLRDIGINRCEIKTRVRSGK